MEGRFRPAKALCDTGADTSLSLNPAIAKKLETTNVAKRLPLAKPILLGAFYREVVAKATYYIRLTLIIEGRYFNKQRFLIIPSCNKVIISCKWLTKYNVALFPATNILWFSKDQPVLAKYLKGILTPLRRPLFNLAA